MVDGLLRESEGTSPARFDLHDVQHATFGGYEVDLKVRMSPIQLQYLEASGTVIVCSQGLPRLAGIDGVTHRLKFVLLYQTPEEMKKSGQLLLIFASLLLVSALYRLIPNRPWGFAPQIAMALFSGSVVKDKKFSFLLPLGSMFLSDLLFQVLHNMGITDFQGFYDGQWVNYLLFTGLTILGWFVSEKNILQIGLGALAGPVLYFFASNTATWAAGAGWHRPYTWAGYVQALEDGLPFFKGSLYATVLFSAVFFGGYALWRRRQAGATLGAH